MAVFCNWADWFESFMVENPEDRFSCDKAQNLKVYFYVYHHDAVLWNVVTLTFIEKSYSQA